MHFHNARTRQRKIILDSFCYKLFFIPWNSFPTIFHLQLNFLSFITTRVKYTMFCIFPVHFHNARTRQRKIILDSFCYKLFFIPWNSFPTIFHLQLNFLSFITTRVKYTMFCSFFFCIFFVFLSL